MSKIKRYVDARRSVGPFDEGLFTFLLLETLAEQLSDDAWDSCLQAAKDRTALYQEVVEPRDFSPRQSGSLRDESLHHP